MMRDEDDDSHASVSLLGGALRFFESPRTSNDKEEDTNGGGDESHRFIPYNKTIDTEECSNPDDAVTAATTATTTKNEPPPTKNESRKRADVTGNCNSNNHRKRRIIVMAAALVLLVVGLLIGAVLALSATREKRDKDDDSASRPLDQVTIYLYITTDVITIPSATPTLAPVASTAKDVVPVTTPTRTPSFLSAAAAADALCTDVSYQLGKLALTAQQILESDGNTLKHGLETAAATIAQEFVQQYNDDVDVNTNNSNDKGLRNRPRPSRALRVLSQIERQQRGHEQWARSPMTLAYSENHPAVVTAIVETSAFCATPICVVVKQTVCVVWAGEAHVQEDGNKDNDADVLAAFRHFLKQAITSGRLVEAVPPQDLPP